MNNEAIQIEHVIPGRIRLKMVQLKHNPEFAKVVEGVIREVAHPKEMRFNLTIGSLAIEFDPKIPSIIEHFAKMLDLFMPGESEDKTRLKGALNQLQATEKGNRQGPVTPPSITPGLDALNSSLRKAAASTTDLKAVIPFLLLSLGVGSLLLADPLTYPAWYEYFWFAFATYLAFYGIRRVTA